MNIYNTYDRFFSKKFLITAHRGKYPYPRKAI